jgi:hypothetical protein
MKKAGLPYDYDKVTSLKRMKRMSGPPHWRMLKAAVAWRVMFRFFKNQSHRHKVLWRSDLKRLKEDYAGEETGFVNEIVADNMADQILMLGGFEDKRIRRKLGKEETDE